MALVPINEPILAPSHNGHLVAVSGASVEVRAASGTTLGAGALVAAWTSPAGTTRAEPLTSQNGRIDAFIEAQTVDLVIGAVAGVSLADVRRVTYLAASMSAHKGTHAVGGSDVLAPADIGAAPLASPQFTGGVGVGAAPIAGVAVAANGIVRSTRAGVPFQYFELDGGDSGVMRFTATAGTPKVLIIDNQSPAGPSRGLRLLVGGVTKLQMDDSDHVTLLAAGAGLVVRSPDGLTTRRIGIDNTGAVVAV